jgi:hypothetical protein
MLEVTRPTLKAARRDQLASCGCPVGSWVLLACSLWLFAGCGEDELVDPSKSVNVPDGGTSSSSSGGSNTSSSSSTSSSGANTLDTGSSSSSGSSNSSGGNDAGSGAASADIGMPAVAQKKGEATKLVETNGALFVTTSDDAVFWTDTNKLAVHKYDGSASFLLASEQPGVLPWDLALVGKTVFFGARSKSLYYVRKVPAKGGLPGTAATVKPALPVQIIRQMSSDGTYIYFVTGSGDGPTYAGLVRRLDPDEAEVVNLAQYQKEPTSIAVSDFVYWTTRQGPAVWRTAKDGTGKPKVLVQDITKAVDLALDDGFIYYLNETGLSADVDGGTVMRAPGGGGVPVIIAKAQDAPLSIALSSDHVWWVTRGTVEKGFGDGAVWRLSKGGGEPEKIAGGLPQPWDLAVRGQSVFWTCRGTPSSNGGLWGWVP